MVFTPQAKHEVLKAANTGTVLDSGVGLDYQSGMKEKIVKPKKAHPGQYLADHRKEAGLADHQLAELMKTSQAQINRLENGERKLSVEWLNKFVIALGKSREELLCPVGVNSIVGNATNSVDKSETMQIVSQPANAGLANEPTTKTRRYIDILGHAAGGREGKFILNGERIDRFLCPPSMEASSNPYALYIYGTSMAPRYEDGEMVLANPDMPYRQGSYVVAQLKTADETVFECYVKRFVSFNSKELVLEQLNPPKGCEALMRFPADRVHAIHKLVGPNGK